MKTRTSILMTLCFVVIIIIPQAFAVIPNITSVEGKIMRGENVTLHGSSFAVKDPVEPLIGDQINNQPASQS